MDFREILGLEDIDAEEMVVVVGGDQQVPADLTHAAEHSDRFYSVDAYWYVHTGSS